jgi:hypothetical protein
MKKFNVTVVFSYIDTIEVEAENREDAKAMAFDLFDEERMVRCDGEVLEVEEEA